MKDQAHSLRQALQNKNKTGKTICISSGKGGVGKSNITLSLGTSIAEKGKRVIIIDGDIGLANLEILMGKSPEYSFLDIIEEKKSPYEVAYDGPNDLKIISGGSGIMEIMSNEEEKIDIFIKTIQELRHGMDYILIDTGAGISRSVTSFAQIADEVIVVTTKEPPAVADAYSLIKTLSIKDINRNINLVVNRVKNKTEAEKIYLSLNKISESFISTKLVYLGYVLEDSAVPKSVIAQKPFYTNKRESKASKCINEISSKVLGISNEDIEDEDFFSKLKKIFK